jgi:Tfp pilus assembly protein PilF
MVPGQPGGSPGGTLVDEIHQQRVRAVHEKLRQRRRRVRFNVFFGIALFAALVVTGIVVKHFVDQHRIDKEVEDARADIAASTPGDLARAVQRLEANLGIEAGHPRTLGLLALARAYQAAMGLVAPEEAHAAVDAAGTRDEAPLSAGILAALEGDFDEARRAYEAIDDAAETPTELVSTAAWLQGIVALGRPYEEELTDAAHERIDGALAADPSWVPNRRILAALLARQGRFDEALAAVEAAREHAPNHIGLSVDEALYHALTYQHGEGVLQVTEIVLLSEGTPPREAAHARLARGVTLIHDGEVVEGVAALEACWATLPAWDNHGRDLVLQSLLTAGRVEKAEKLRAAANLGSQADAIFAAWHALLDGDAFGALARLEELPQGLPRVAHLQALALAEQRRWEEADKWVKFARAALPHRPDLAVAEARSRTQRGDAAALSNLEELAKAHPYTYRVWTGMAEALAAIDEPSDAQIKELLEAIDRATKREPAPAEALYLLGRHHEKEARKDPKAATAALDGYRKATVAAAGNARYAAAYGELLANEGQWEEADEVLRKAVALEQAPPGSFIALARVVILRAQSKRAPVPDEVETWLTEAGNRGGDPWALELEWARLQLARRTAESLSQAELRARRLLEQLPDHVEGRVIHALALKGQGRFDDARKTLTAGIGKTPARLDGSLHVALAMVDVADGKLRPAAKEALRGWGKLLKEPASAADLLLTAPFVAGVWLELDGSRTAISVAKGLTDQVPFSAEAWVFRGDTEFAAGENGCASASKAMEIDEELASAHALVGDCWRSKYKFDKAKAAYLQAAKLAKGTVAAGEYKKKAKRL